MIHRSVFWRLTRKIILFLILAAAIAIVVWWRDQNRPNSSTKSQTQSSKAPSSEKTFNKNQYSTSDPSSIWVVVNKSRLLPADYAPANLTVPKVTLGEGAATDNMHLRADASSAVENLIKSANSDGTKLMLVSGYRSYATQQAVYSGYVSSQGKAFADSTSARAGHSEHQTGLAADLGAASGTCQLEKCFADTPEGKWLAANAYRYGFIIRYQKGTQSLTGYDYEPWHVRYIGTPLAAEVNKSGQTLEQFFDLPAFSDYPTENYQLKIGS